MQSGNHIDANDPEDVLAWARSLNTTPERLRDAVHTVGDNPATVMTHLSKLPRRGRVAWTWMTMPEDDKASLDGASAPIQMRGILKPGVGPGGTG